MKKAYLVRNTVSVVFYGECEESIGQQALFKAITDAGSDIFYDTIITELTEDNVPNEQYEEQMMCLDSLGNITYSDISPSQYLETQDSIVKICEVMEGLGWDLGDNFDEDLKNAITAVIGGSGKI